MVVQYSDGLHPPITMTFSSIIATKPTTTTSSVHVCSSWITAVLLSIISIQWILFTMLLLSRGSGEKNSNLPIPYTVGIPATHDQMIDTMYTTIQQRRDAVESISDNSIPKLDGVAVTILYRAPKWFHVRYKVMIDNILMNLPNRTTWKVQIFINNQFFDDQNVIQWNPGLQQYITLPTTSDENIQSHHPQVIVTSLPSNLTSRRYNKPKDVLYSSWFWNSIIADRVLLFTGNGAFCGNQMISNIWKKHQLYDLDYLGVPSNTFPNDIGGDGSTHSVRNRHAMIRIINYRKRKNITTFHYPEDHETVKTMIQINKEQTDLNDDGSFTPFKIASKEQTIVFGGVYDLINNVTEGLVRLPLVVSGTQSRLTYQERDIVLKHCPEIKIIFPSLHEPSCFGAHPNPITCKASICALQDTISSHGC